MAAAEIRQTLLDGLSSGYSSSWPPAPPAPPPPARHTLFFMTIPLSTGEFMANRCYLARRKFVDLRTLTNVCGVSLVSIVCERHCAKLSENARNCQKLLFCIGEFCIRARERERESANFWKLAATHSQLARNSLATTQTQ